MLINPIDFLKQLRQKEPDEFEDVAMIVADYIREEKGNGEAYREIHELMCEPPERHNGLRLVVNR